MESMSNSLFLDPFQDPSAAPAGASADSADPGSECPAPSAETLPGVVVDSAATVDRAGRVLAALTPLDLVDTAGAFLDDTHLWWPADLKATGSEGHVYFGEGKILEEGTEGEIHHWGTVLGASETTLEVDWLGHRPDVPGAPAAVEEGSRIFLSWTGSAPIGTELSVRGADSGSWVGEWDGVLTAFARFTGGRRREGSEGAGGDRG